VRKEDSGEGSEGRREYASEDKERAVILCVWCVVCCAVCIVRWVVWVGYNL